MSIDSLVAISTTTSELVPLRYIESIRESTDCEQKLVAVLSDEAIIYLHTLSGKDHIVKASDMKETIENLLHLKLTSAEVAEIIISTWLQRVNRIPKSHPFL